METHVTLPKWLDDYIFNELGAKYCRSNADMTVIDWDKSDMLNYLGTYFPRSYAEAYCIFGDYFIKSKPQLLEKNSIPIFDFGCGTGGEIVGLITQIKQHNERLKEIKVYGMDGNHHALRLCEPVLDVLTSHLGINIIFTPIPVTIDDFYDLSILNSVLNDKYDIIITFKAICEFVSKERFEKENAYSYIIKTLLPKLDQDGLMLLVDITSYSDITNEWLPKMMDAGILSQPCKKVHINEGYNLPIYVTHSHQNNDVSKVAWRMITHKI